MELSHYESIGKGLKLLRDGLVPFVKRELEKKGMGSIDDEEWDTQRVLKVLREHWNSVFRNTLGHRERSYVSELIEVRNDWAHQRDFNDDDTYRALDTMARLLRSVSAPQAEEVNNLRIGASESEDERIRIALQRYPTELVFYIRKRLASECGELHEKFNENSRYFGYGISAGKDRLYIYVQKKQLVIDIDIPVERVDELRKRGFRIEPRNNWQGRAGWLTGLKVPHNTDRRDEIVALALDALMG